MNGRVVPTGAQGKDLLGKNLPVHSFVLLPLERRHGRTLRCDRAWNRAQGMYPQWAPVGQRHEGADGFG